MGDNGWLPAMMLKTRPVSLLTVVWIVLSVVFADRNMGLAVGTRGVIYGTIHEGKIWQPLFSPTSYDLTSVDTMSCLWPVFIKAALPSSFPAGSVTWSPLFPASAVPTVITGPGWVSSTTQGHLCGLFWVMAGAVGQVWLTFDGMQTWRQAMLPNAYANDNVYAIKLLNPHGMSPLVSLCCGSDLFETGDEVTMRCLC